MRFAPATEHNDLCKKLDKTTAEHAQQETAVKQLKSCSSYSRTMVVEHTICPGSAHQKDMFQAPNSEEWFPSKVSPTSQWM